MEKKEREKYMEEREGRERKREEERERMLGQFAFSCLKQRIRKEKKTGVNTEKIDKVHFYPQNACSASSLIISHDVFINQKASFLNMPRCYMFPF